MRWKWRGRAAAAAACAPWVIIKTLWLGPQKANKSCNWWNFSKELQPLTERGRSNGGTAGQRQWQGAAADATKQNVAWLCACVCHCGLTGNMREFDEHGKGAPFQLPLSHSPSLSRSHCLTSARSSCAVFWVGVYGALGATDNYVVHTLNTHTLSHILIYYVCLCRYGKVMLSAYCWRHAVGVCRWRANTFRSQIGAHRCLWGLERLTPGAAINGQWAVAKPRTTLRLAFLFISAAAVAVACHSFHLFYFVLRELKPISFIAMLIVYYLLFIVDIVYNKARMK